MDSSDNISMENSVNYSFKTMDTCYAHYDYYVHVDDNNNRKMEKNVFWKINK